MTPPDCIQDLSSIARRIAELSEWLGEHGENCSAQQTHLEEGSQARIYWHYGYMVALKDVLRFLTGERLPNQKSYKRDSSNSHPFA
jgi:hypothetical protein